MLSSTGKFTTILNLKSPGNETVFIYDALFCCIRYCDLVDSKIFPESKKGRKTFEGEDNRTGRQRKFLFIEIGFGFTELCFYMGSIFKKIFINKQSLVPLLFLQ